MIDELRGKNSTSGDTDANNPDVTSRAQTLEQTIAEERQRRLNNIVLQEGETRLQQRRQLLEKGFISDALYQRELAELNKLKATIEDTEEIEQWKAELDRLRTRSATAAVTDVRKNPLLHDLLTRSFNAKLEHSAVQQRSKQVKLVRQRLTEEYATLLRNRPSIAAEVHMVPYWQREIEDLERTAAKVRAVRDAKGADFSYISRAEVPSGPMKSYRKLYCFSFFAIGGGIGFWLVVIWELLDTRIKSKSELALKLPLPVLGVLPKVAGGFELSDMNQAQLADPIRTIAHRIRSAVPKPDARILFVSAGPGEGRTTVTAHLACCFGKQGEAVLMADAHVRDGSHQQDLRDLVVVDKAPIHGLGDYLRGKTDRLEQLMWPTKMYGVICLPRSIQPCDPVLLGSARMRSLLDENLKGRDLLVLIDGTPVAPYADAEMLAQNVDAIVLVIQSRRCMASMLCNVVERLSTSGTPVIGTILNQVERRYLEPEWNEPLVHALLPSQIVHRLFKFPIFNSVRTMFGSKQAGADC